MQDLFSKIKAGSEQYRPIPFWSWNDKLEPEELARQIQWMKEQGIGGFFMHARSGLKTEYLSEEWMQAIEACCQEAEEQGMEAWIYDENGWPSGFAGGKLLEDPENRDMYLTATQGTFEEKADLHYGLTDEKLIQVTEPGAYGEYLNLYFHRSASTADILDKTVVQKFLDLTHNAYQQRFGETFAQKVSGFFTDEPQYYRADTSYTPRVADYFREVYQQDVFEKLGLLFTEKEGYQAFRYRYWLAMQTLMLDGFAKQVYGWCDENGVKLTGHYVEEVTLGTQITCCGGVMPFYEYEHIPGIDWLGAETDNELSPRQLGSAARQLGKTQTLTETYAACGWNTSPADLRRIAGFQYACGVNRFCHHLLPYSESGQRKRDYPPHFSQVNPWIKDYFRDFNDYFSRLGCLLAQSQEPVNVAVLHPIRSGYLFHRRDLAKNGAFPENPLDEGLLKLCRMLSSRGISYHFLDETLLERHGFVEEGRIGCGQCSYDYLLLPDLVTTGSHTQKLLQQYVDEGGKVLALGALPTSVEGEPSDWSFLKSNCSMEEVLASQRVTMEDPDTELYCTYRLWEGKPFLFVQNASAKQGFTQRFSFRDDTASFLALDLISGETKPMPLTVRLEKNEALVLFLSNDPAPAQKEQKTLDFRFSQGNAEFERNFMTLDTLQYSTDGVTFSQNISCRDLFQRLLEQRYRGKLWLRYGFTVRELPPALTLLTEAKGAAHYVNGQPIAFGPGTVEGLGLQEADIRPCVQLGENFYETRMEFSQTEETYYALFGEGVTEALRNCIVYDSEIEAVYLAGKFGVYAQSPWETFDQECLLGKDFYLGPVPQAITEPVTEGLPFFRGDLTLTQEISLSQRDVLLRLEGEYMAAKVWLNDQYVGAMFLNNSLDLYQFAKEGVNTLKVAFTLGNRNFLGPFHSREEKFVSPDNFQCSDFDQGIYKFRKFYI